MNREKVIKDFILQNLSLLDAPTYDKSRIKNTKKKFFVEKHRKKFGSPKYKEIAIVFVELFIGSSIKTKEELRDFVEKRQFCRDYIHDLSKLEGLLDETTPLTDTDEIKKLKRLQRYESIREEVKEEVFKESTKEIDYLIEKKKAEYLSLPSVLDKGEFEEPEYIETVDSDEQQLWWQRLNLISNPFQKHEGLYLIPTVMYDKVVLKTSIFNSYLNKAKSNPEQLLYNAKPVLGEAGSGKTTLFDYLLFALSEYKIKVFRITIPPRGDSMTFNTIFENRLHSKVSKFYKERFKYDFHWKEDTGTKMDPTIEILNKLTDAEGWSYLVVIDDLHKVIGGEDIVWDFLAGLQIIKDDLIRNDVKLGILVAGLPIWRDIINTNAMLRGFFDAAPDFMPEVTPEIAYEVIRRRFKAFSKNKNAANAIDINFIKQVHRKAMHKGTLFGFRTFMSDIEHELHYEGNYSIFESNPMEIEEEKLEAIRHIIDENETLKASFNRYVFGRGIKSEENRDLGLRILVKTFLDDGTYESDSFFIENKFHYRNLAYSNLINKDPSGEDGVRWTIAPELKKINKRILEEFNLSLEDYLRPLYISPGLRKKKASPKKQDRFDVFIAENEKSLDEYMGSLKTSVILYRDTMALSAIDLRKSDFFELIETWQTSLSQLSLCVFKLENLLPITTKSPDKILDKWTEYWRYPEQLKRFIYEHRACPEDKESLPLLRGCYKEAYTELFDIFDTTFKINEKIHISLENLKESEIEKLYQIRNLFISPYSKMNYFQLLDELNRLLEDKIRTFFFNFFRVIYGSRKNRINQINDKSIKVYIDKRDKRPEYNEFEELNRGQYKKIFMEDKNLRRMLFLPIFGVSYTSKIKWLLEVFSDTNIITSHAKKSSISPEQSSNIYRYILDSTDFIKKINIAYSNLFDKYFYLKEGSGDDIEIYFSLQGVKEEKKGPNEEICEIGDDALKEHEKLEPIKIKSEDIVRITNILKARTKSGEYFMNLEEYETIADMFASEYRKAIAVLAYLNYTKKIKIKSIMGANFVVKLISNK